MLTLDVFAHYIGSKGSVGCTHRQCRVHAQAVRNRATVLAVHVGNMEQGVCIRPMSLHSR